MEAKDLRIGNLVHTCVNGEYQDILVDELTAETLNGFKSYLREASGIELSEEWLVRLGFEVRENNSKDRYWIGEYLYSEGGLFLHFSMDEGDKFIPCNYVHELQNLYFALTKKELEVKQIA